MARGAGASLPELRGLGLTSCAAGCSFKSYMIHETGQPFLHRNL